MAFFETATFGGGGIPITTAVKATTEYFAGTEYSKSGRLQVSAQAAKGIDFGSDFGSYRHRLAVCVRCVQKLTFKGSQQPDTVEIALYESADNKTFKENGRFTIPVATLNKATRTPIMFTPISDNARYMCIGIKFSGNSATSSDTGSTGNLLLTLEPTSF